MKLILYTPWYNSPKNLYENSSKIYSSDSDLDRKYLIGLASIRSNPIKFSTTLFTIRSGLSDQVFETPQSDQVNPIKFNFRDNPIRSIRSSFIFGSIRSGQSDQVFFSGQSDQVNPIKFFLRLNPIRSIRSGFFKSVCRPLG